jgi:hypothetical protein
VANGSQQQRGTPGGASAANPVERRKQPRFSVDVPARLTVEGATFPGHLRDVCRDAAWVESEHGCALGTEIALAVELPGTGGPILVEGRVIRVAPGDTAPNGMAILFKDLPPASATRIDFFIALQDG